MMCKSELELKTLQEALSNNNKHKWIERKNKDLKLFQENRACDLVELPAGNTTTGCQWGYTGCKQYMLQGFTEWQGGSNGVENAS